MGRIVSRLAAIALTAAALMAGLATITTVQATAAPITPVIEAGIPEGQEAGAYVDGQRRCLAAELVLTRIVGGGRIESDWAWTGAPYVVAEQNDALVTDMRDAGYGYDSADAFEWLAGKVGACTATYGQLSGEED